MSTNFNSNTSGAPTNVMGSGIRSVINPSGKSYYILEHQVSSNFHQAGEQQKIIVDSIELGRDARCQVRFDESFNTVSRRHAMIVRDNDRWKIVPLSATNSTFLNGQRLSGEWYLQSGDEIQLSVNGPKLRFIIPDHAANGNMSNIGLTARLQLYSKQALLPYRRALIGGAIALALAIGALVWLLFWTNDIDTRLDNQNAYIAQLMDQSKGNQLRTDSLARELARTNDSLFNAMKHIEGVEKMARQSMSIAQAARCAAGPAPGAFSALSQYIYFIQVQINFNGEEMAAATGTAFLLKDGRLVTARHCVDMAYQMRAELEDNPFNTIINTMVNYYSEQVDLRLIGISGSGKTIDISFKPGQNWVWGDAPSETGYIAIEDESGEVNNYPVNYMLQLPGDDDWAYIQTNERGGLDFDPQLSQNLKMGTKVQILGFPMAVGTETIQTTGAVNPIYSQAAVGHDGLYEGGVIMLDNDDIEHGNSGGPVFTLGKSNQPVVIGIVSGLDALGLRTGTATGRSRFVGRVVPISAIK